jgi:hypothetical protein
MCAQILERLTIFQGHIRINNQLHRNRHDATPPTETPKGQYPDGYLHTQENHQQAVDNRGECGFGASVRTRAGGIGMIGSSPTKTTRLRGEAADESP